MLHFKETSLFTKQIKALINDDEYRLLQNDLILNPHQGDLVRGTGGVRKTRWALQTGKSDGIRIIYFYVDSHGVFFMLLAYPKSKKTTLTAAEKKELLKLTTAIKEVYKHAE